MKRGQRCHHDKYGRDWRAIAMLLLVSALRLLTYSVPRGWNTQLMTMTTMTTCTLRACRPPVIPLHSAGCLNETAKGSPHE
jgi:hypothetical protein